MPSPLQGTRGIGVEAFFVEEFVEEKDAGAEGEEHDGETGGDELKREWYALGADSAGGMWTWWARSGLAEPERG
jgi:hypothetical protein